MDVKLITKMCQKDRMPSMVSDNYKKRQKIQLEIKELNSTEVKVAYSMNKIKIVLKKVY